MLSFSYRAIESSGVKQSGMLWALDKPAAHAQLRHKGWHVLRLAETKAHKPLRFNQLLAITKQLHLLLKSGMPICESLQILAKHSSASNVCFLINQLVFSLQEGKLFSEALQENGASFDKMYVAMVASCEAIGSLDQAMEQLVQYLEKQSSYRKKLVSSLVYPFFYTGFFSLCTSSFTLLGHSCFCPFFRGKRTAFCNQNSFCSLQSGASSCLFFL